VLLQRLCHGTAVEDVSGVDVIGFRRVEISLDPDYGIAYSHYRP
jgi:hypothetical protein